MKKNILFLLVICVFFSCSNTGSNRDLSYSGDYSREITWHDIYHKKIPAAKGWKYIVIHHSATHSGSAYAFHKYHTKKGYGGLAYHFVIGNGNGAGNGEVQAGFRWKEQIAGTHVTVNAWYHNVFGIGICLVGNFQKYRPSARQLRSLIKLIKKLSKKYNIPAQNVIGHGGVPHGGLIVKNNKIIFAPNGKKERRVCPGRYFPMKYVKKMAFGK